MDTKTIMGITIAVLVIALIVTNTPAMSPEKLRKKLERKCRKKKNKNRHACKGLGVVGPAPGSGGNRATRSGLL